MPNRLMLVIAATLGAFLFVLLGGLGTYLLAPTAADPAPVPAATVAPGLDPAAVQALLAEREAAYGRQIAEANARLQQAYQADPTPPPALPAPSTLAPPTAPPAPPAPPDPAVTPDQAVAIGRAVAPGARLLRVPELVDFTGTPAYELTFDRGQVYVDAATGQVLYNGAAQVARRPAPVAPQRSEDDEHEHEGDDD
jgi:uncharacterized membrane protein YkoI